LTLVWYAVVLARRYAPSFSFHFKLGDLEGGKLLRANEHASRESFAI
jgi:hypothetical protein